MEIIMKHLYQIATKHKALILLFISMGLVIAFLQGFAPRYFQTIVDGFTDGGLTGLNIAIYGTALILLYILNYAHEYPWRKLDHSIRLGLKLAALKKVSVIDYLAYTKLGTGMLIQRIENGSAAGGSILFGFYLHLAAVLLPGMIFSIIFVFTISQGVTIAILLGYLVVFVISNLLLKALYRVKERILVNEEKFNHFLVRGFMEMVVFRINRRFFHEISKADAAAGEIVASSVKMSMVHEAFFAIFAVIVGFAKIGIIVFGWRTDALTIGQIVALIVLVDNAYQPIAIFNVLYVQFKLDKIAFGRYTEFLDAEDEVRLMSLGRDGKPHASSEFPTTGQASLNRNYNNTLAKITSTATSPPVICFSNVGFSYNDRQILSDFNLSIQPGTSTAFVGESGSGKSTAIKLLVGLLTPGGGTVTVEGTNLAQVNLNDYYKHIAYLPQEPSIFDGSLRENLVFDNMYEDAALIDAIEKVKLGGLLAKLGQGLDTPLGEKGISLSGGERQQLALARLWFTDAKIIILDEATSAIDNLTEEAVMGSVMSQLTGKTVIAIAHRLDSVRGFDNIIVFQDGRVVEDGRFDEMLVNKGHFYELYNRG